MTMLQNCNFTNAYKLQEDIPSPNKHRKIPTVPQIAHKTTNNTENQIIP